LAFPAPSVSLTVASRLSEVFLVSFDRYPKAAVWVSARSSAARRRPSPNREVGLP